jgi:aspartyl protease family protein
MTDIKGPWEQVKTPPPPRPAPSPAAPRRASRGLIVMGVLALGAIGVWALAGAFPGRLADGGSWENLIWGGAMLALVTASLLARRIPLKDMARNFLIWGALAAVLAVGYSFRDELAEVGRRIRSGLAPAYPVASAPHELLLTQDADGQYYAVAEVDGRPVTFMVDTGASDIVLSPADARRIGVDLAALHFDYPYETANGEGRGARYQLGSLALGGVRLADVPVSINQQPMRTSLLGMAFFKRLDSYAFEGRRLRLKWK